MTKKRIRLLVIAAVLVLALVLLAAYFFVYKSTKRLSFDLTASDAQGTLVPPQFLFMFSGQGPDRLQRPIGVAVVGPRVYVVDTTKHTVFVYNQDGRQLSKFGTTETVTPLYIAANPTNGNLYVTDRRKRAVFMFTPEGEFLGEFKPNLPKNQRPKVTADKIQWAPVAVAFGKDGTMYVTEVLKGHRLLIYAPDGTFKRSVGDLGVVNDPALAPNVFQFPNGLTVVGNELYVADSNNRRIQVFDLEGTFKRIIVTQGLPRGIVSLNRFPSDAATGSPVRVASVDTLSHFVTIWDGAKGDKIVSFGEQGALDGQFSYPDGIALGSSNKLFVTDTANGRVQVWGWPLEVARLPYIGSPLNLLWCCLPLLLLPLLLLGRKRRFFATADFVERMIVMEQADLMPASRRAWLTLESEYELIKQMQYNDINFADLFEVTEYSESDAHALAEKYELDEATSILMAAASRARVFATEQPDHRRLAKTMEIDVVDALEFVKRFTRKTADTSTPTSGSDE